MIEQGRDPRVDPKPGDDLRGTYLMGGTCRRRVTCVTPLGNVFMRERGRGERLIGPDEWRNWAKDAEVVKRAE